MTLKYIADLLEWRGDEVEKWDQEVISSKLRKVKTSFTCEDE